MSILRRSVDHALRPHDDDTFARFVDNVFAFEPVHFARPLDFDVLPFVCGTMAGLIGNVQEMVHGPQFGIGVMEIWNRRVLFELFLVQRLLAWYAHLD